MKTVDLRGLTKDQVANKVMEVHTEETAKLIFQIYAKFINDTLDVECLEELGFQFGVDIREKYIQKALKYSEEGDED